MVIILFRYCRGTSKGKCSWKFVRFVRLYISNWDNCWQEMIKHMPPNLLLYAYIHHMWNLSNRIGWIQIYASNGSFDLHIYSPKFHIINMIRIHFWKIKWVCMEKKMCSIILIKFYLAHMCTTRIHNKGVSININSQLRSMRCRNKLLSIGIYSQRTAKQPITNALNFFSSTIFAVHFATNGKNQ